MQLIPQRMRLTDDECKYISQFLKEKRDCSTPAYKEVFVNLEQKNIFDFYLDIIWLTNRSPLTTDEMNHVGFGRIGVGIKDLQKYFVEIGFINDIKYDVS